MISDTHGKHDRLRLPAGDLLVHAGDVSKRGREPEVRDFLQWFGRQPHPHKVMVAGNHDFLFERDPQGARALVPEGVHLLENAGVELGGLRIWGSPITPFFHNWAFNVHRGPDIAGVWAHIPAELDLLITHGPPLGILDRTIIGQRVGCEDLRQRLYEAPPRLHVFGHIHEDHGQVAGETVDPRLARCRFVNASTLNLRYQVAHDPVVVDL